MNTLAILGTILGLGFTSGLNLYSDTSSHVSILVAINQPVTPSAANILVPLDEEATENQ